LAGSLVAALNGAPDAAGAYSRHLPHEGAGFIARQIATYWHTQQGGRIVQRIDDAAAFERLGGEAKQRICTFNNVSSIIRRAVWERLPLRDIPYAEDLAWGLDVLRAGHTLIYEPASVCIIRTRDR
jgi:rhamnosyltransferase